MALQKIGEFDPNYHQTIEGKDFKGMSVYAQGNNEKIGTVDDAVVDAEGKFRYLVVDLGFWIFGKKVLLPIGRANIDSGADRVYVTLTKEQAEDLPEYQDSMALDYDYEERVRGVYRTPSQEASLPLNTTTAAYDRNTYTYAQDADLFDTGTHADQTIKLYEERLIASKQRRKTGEVVVGKHIETETERLAVPVEKERVVIERVTPTDTDAVPPGEALFQEGEVAHVEIYEEVADIHKEAFVREEVRVKKVVEQQTVEAEETLRREELDIDTEGRPVVERPSDRI